MPTTTVAPGDLLLHAAQEAAENPLPRLPHLGESYRRVASIAAALHRLLAGGSFILPRDLVATILNISPQGVSNVIRQLEADNLLLCVDHRYGRGTRCKRYIWTYREDKPDLRPAGPWRYRTVFGTTVVIEGSERLDDTGIIWALQEALSAMTAPDPDEIIKAVQTS